MRKWVNYETNDKELNYKLRVFLNGMSIKYETSGMGEGWVHFEILADADECRTINNYLDFYLG